MSNIVERIKWDLAREERRQKLLNKKEKEGRLADYLVYQKIKTAKLCAICQKKIRRRPKLAHTIPIKYLGSNDKSNLKPAHDFCERKEDIEKDELVEKLMKDNNTTNWKDIKEIIHKEIFEKYGQRKN